MKRKKNPQDSTLRNVRAANTRIKLLERHVKALQVGFHAVWKVDVRVANLERQDVKARIELHAALQRISRLEEKDA